MTGENVSHDVYSAMQTGEPYKSYKKTVLGKVDLALLDAFSGSPTHFLLRGKPGELSTTIDVWSEREDAFFRRMNRKFLEDGTIMEFKREGNSTDIPQTVNNISDEQLEELLDARKNKFYSFSSILNKMDSEAVLARLLDKAIELEKSDKIVNTIKARLSEIQTKSFLPESSAQPEST